MAKNNNFLIKSPRLLTETWEKINLAPYASLSSNAQRRYEEEQCACRTAYQIDRDRIIHSKAFRRLAHKTQVFLSPKKDHYRTRLTHTLEVNQIARTLARAFRLNEDLTEAIALAHDLGHTPFGHAGEKVLNCLHPYGFSHYRQSLRVVDYLAGPNKCLNLTALVRNGILYHSKGRGPIFNYKYLKSHEGQLVRISDIIAYLAHDTDDAIRAGLLSYNIIPEKFKKFIGSSPSLCINNLVMDLLQNSESDTKTLFLKFSPETETFINDFRDYLYANVYYNIKIMEDFNKCEKIISDLYSYLLNNKDAIDKYISSENKNIINKETIICDFISGMTDRYALYLYKKIFLPKSWNI